MKIIVDQSHIHDFLAAFANSRLRIQTTQVQVSHASDVKRFTESRKGEGASTTPAARALIEAMTTHETMFYRDAAFWQTFDQVIIPRLATLAKGGGRPRIWSAACSTGQEPYSIAMMIEERAGDVAPRIELVATDVAELSVQRAREGLFTPLEVNRNVNAADVAIVQSRQGTTQQ